MKVLTIGDMHFRPERGYAQYIEDGRRAEVKNTIDFIINIGRSCDAVVLLGDNLDSKNNSSSVIKEFVSFIESFAPTPVYIIAGNHTKTAAGASAEDFLKEIEGKHWKVFTDSVGEEILSDGTKMVFCPYFYKNEFGLDSNEEATQHLMDILPSGDFLFAHHGVTGSQIRHLMVDTFNEIVLPADELEKRYRGVLFGHIHGQQLLNNGKILGTGSVFCDEAGEVGKSVWVLDTSDGSYEEHKLPSRGIYSLVDPTLRDLELIDEKNIIKSILTNRLDAPQMEQIKERLRKFDAYVLLEQYPDERKKLVHNDAGNILDLSIEELLEIYAKNTNTDLIQLIKGWEIIKQTI